MKREIDGYIPDNRSKMIDPKTRGRVGNNWDTLNDRELLDQKKLIDESLADLRGEIKSIERDRTPNASRYSFTRKMANSGEVSLPITELEKVVMRRYGDLLRDIRTKVMLDNDCCKQIKKRKKKPKDHPMLLGIRVYIKKAKNNSWRAKKAKRVRLALASNRKNCSI